MMWLQRARFYLLIQTQVYQQHAHRLESEDPYNLRVLSIGHIPGEINFVEGE
jgi:hypothetical protein